jgi:aarF domain-containing kinase
MSRRGLLDLITVLNASRNVAKKHVALQRKHLDVHARTSSVTKELKAQADRISLAVQAASDLARKLDDDVPTPARTTREETAREAAVGTEDGKPDSHDINTESGQRIKSDTLEKPIQREEAHETLAELEQYPPQEASPTPNKSEPSEAPTNEQTADSPEEPSERVVQELFRSPRVASNILDGQKYASYHQRYARPTEKTHIPRIRTVIDSVPTISQAEADPLAAAEPVQPASTESIAGAALNSGDDVLSPSTHDGISVEAEQRERHQMIESRVPSSRVGRLWEYGGLAASMAFGVVGESIRRSSGQNDANGSLLLSPGNIERLVNKLSKMRGAALKLGQMMSFQGSRNLSPLAFG